MKKRITIIDYGMGNLLSVKRAFEHFGAQTELTGDPGSTSGADYLILPGVGAFADGMDELRRRGLVDAFRAHAQSGRPSLSICLGMQMLLAESQEFGKHDGLGIIDGAVVEIPLTGADGTAHKVPHIGWSELRLPDGADADHWRGTILDGIVPGVSVYFVHSFTAAPSDPDSRLADADYNGRLVSAAVRHENVFGTQFHPEKSGPVGLRIIENFLHLG
ncbi:MAG: imidazole glycerol phosphate synthase subunit HisH [Rhodospirillales bacterium]|nr:imidazole glycerol phosphate synthase subunit HisH [Rhodospirillales bacterium]